MYTIVFCEEKNYLILKNEAKFDFVGIVGIGRKSIFEEKREYIATG